MLRLLQGYFPSQNAPESALPSIVRANFYQVALVDFRNKSLPDFVALRVQPDNGPPNTVFNGGETSVVWQGIS